MVIKRTRKVAVADPYLTVATPDDRDRDRRVEIFARGPATGEHK